MRLAPDRPKIRIVVKDNAPPRDRRNRSQALATSSGSPSDPGMGTRAGRPSVKLRASLRAGSQCTYMFIPVHTCNYVHSKVTTKLRARAGSRCTYMFIPVHTRNYVHSKVTTKLRARAGSRCTYMFIPVHTRNYVHSKVTTKPRARAGSPERRLPASSLLRQRRSRLEPSRPTACEVEHCALNARMPQVFRNQRQLLCIVQTR